MRLDDEVETRDVPHAIRVFQSGDLRPLLRGTAIVFNSRSENLGGFVEIIRPEAFRRTLDEGIDLRALVGHDPDKPIGRLSKGTLRVEVDADGVHVEIEPPNTSLGRDVVESVRRGDMD